MGVWLTLLMPLAAFVSLSAKVPFTHCASLYLRLVIIHVDGVNNIIIAIAYEHFRPG